MRTKFFVGTAALATLTATWSLVAQQTQEASALAPETMARMAPGPMHLKLEPLVGNFSMTGKWRPTPDAPWEEFEAKVEREWILDGRFVQEKVNSEFMGQPFEGIGIIGYDNVREEYTMVWVENMSTGTYSSTGQTEGNKIVFEGVNSDAMTGEKNRWSKSVVDLGGAKQTYQSYCKDDSGKEFVSTEMTGTRK